LLYTIRKKDKQNNDTTIIHIYKYCVLNLNDRKRYSLNNTTVDLTQHDIQGGPKNKPLPSYKKIYVKSYWSPWM